MRVRASAIVPLLSVCLCLGVSSACAVSPASTVTFENTTVPVLVGPVERLGGKPTEAGPHDARVRVEAMNLYRYSSSGHGGGTIHRQTESPAKFDVAVERALDGCGKCQVRVGEVFVGSHAGVLIGTGDDTHWTGADVRLYAPEKK